MEHATLTKMDQLRNFYNAGEYEQAQKIALSLLKNRTDALTATYALGLIKLHTKEYAAALDYFEKALAMDPQQERIGAIYYWIGRTHEERATWNDTSDYRSKQDNAREAYEKATECPSYPADVIHRLALLHPFGHPRLTWYNVGIQQFPNEFPFYIYSSWIYRNENSPIRQLEILQKGLDKNPNSPSLLFEIAQYYYAHQQYEDSLRYIQLALDKNDGGYSMDSLHYFAGSVHFIKGNWDQAISHFELSIQAYPNSNSLWYAVCGLVATCQKKRKLTEARKYVDEVILDRSIFEYVDFQYGLLPNLEGQVLGETGFLQTEADVVPSLKQLHQDSVNVSFKVKTAIVLAGLSQYFNLHEDRFIYLRYAIKHSEEVSYLVDNLTEAYQALAETQSPSPSVFGQLHEDLQTLLTEDQVSTIVETFVEKMFAEKKYAEIVQLCSPLHQDYIAKSQTGFDYAYALSETGKKAEAKMQYELYLKTYPNSSAALNNLALILREIDQFDAALSLFKEAVKIDPSKDLYQKNRQKTIDLQKEKLRSEKAKKIPENWAAGSKSLTVEKLEEMDFFAIHNRIQRVSSKYRLLLQRDWEELVFNYGMRNYKSTVILSGSFVELLLTYYCEKKKVKMIPVKSSNGQVTNRKLYDCVLNELIGYVNDQRWFGGDFSHLSNLARVYRNLIHPGLELKSDGKIKPKAELCFISAKEILQKIL